MPVRNICDCPNPPGGQVDCEPHQLAICMVLNGQARRQCQDPPVAVSEAQLVDWALQQVTGGRVSFQTREAELLMLMQGSLERPDGALVTFTLPEGIRTAVATLAGFALRAQVQQRDYLAH